MPRGVEGAAIPLPARFMHVARDAHAIVLAEGVATALAAMPRALGDTTQAIAALLDGVAARRARGGPREDAVIAAAPAGAIDIEGACAVAGDFADLKSPWTLGHSGAVAELAEAAAWRLGLPADEVAVVRQAALVHDLGRVAISSAIWDRAGPLTEADRERVRLHPYLHRAHAGAQPRRWRRSVGSPGRHHERLDGSGYHRGCGASELPVAARLLAAADVFEAMTEPRAHRPPHTPAAAAAELAAQSAAGRLDAGCAEAVLAAAGQAGERVRPPLPAGLTEREAQVLGLVARGLTNRGDRRATRHPHPRRSATRSRPPTRSSGSRRGPRPRCSRSRTGCCRRADSRDAVWLTGELRLGRATRVERFGGPWLF